MWTKGKKKILREKKHVTQHWPQMAWSKDSWRTAI